MARHWVDSAFERWGASSEFSDAGLRYLEAAQPEVLRARVEEVLAFVNDCAVSQADWDRYRASIGDAARDWPAQLLAVAETAEPRGGRVRVLRVEPEPRGATRSRLWALIHDALTNYRCGEHELVARDLLAGDELASGRGEGKPADQ